MLDSAGNQNPDLISGYLPQVIQGNVQLEEVNSIIDSLKECIVTDVPHLHVL